MTAARPPLTIAHVTGERGFSGGEVQIFLLAEGLAKRGHRNVLLCRPDSRSADEALRRGLETRLVRMRSEWSPLGARGICRQLRWVRPELVFLHTGRANWLGGLACRRLGLPAVTTRRMDRPVRRDLRTRWVYGSVARRAVAVSRAVADRLLAAGVDPAMIRVIHSAVDPGSLAPRRSPAETRAELAASDAPCLLVLAALVERKGIDVLLDALALLARDAIHPELWIAGDGPLGAALAQRARRRGVAQRVRFLGWRDDAADLLAACDAVVLPSRREGLGVSVLEAMAAGRPVVASRVGGIVEAVADESTGLLVEPDDPRALAGALARLLADPGLRRRFGRAGARRVHRAFFAERMVDAYERLSLEVVAEGGR